MQGFKTNVRGLTHAFVFKHNAGIMITVDALSPVTGLLATPTGIEATDTQGKEEALLCHRKGLKVDTLPIDIPDIMEMLFLRINSENRRAILFCAM